MTKSDTTSAFLPRLPRFLSGTASILPLIGLPGYFEACLLIARSLVSSESEDRGVKLPFFSL